MRRITTYDETRRQYKEELRRLRAETEKRLGFSLGPPPEHPMPNDVMPLIASPEHAGRVLRSMSLSSIGLILRGLIAALPSGFWTTLAAIAIRLMPYLSTPALEKSAGVTSQSQLESAIRRTAN